MIVKYYLKNYIGYICLGILSVYSVVYYTYGYSQTLDYVREMEMDIQSDISYEINITNLKETEYGYVAYFKLTSNNYIKKAQKYTGQMYLSQQEVAMYFPEKIRKTFEYRYKPYVVNGQFKKAWVPRNLGEIHPLVYLVSRKSLGVFECIEIKEIEREVSRGKHIFNGLRRNNAVFRLKIKKRIDEQLAKVFRYVEYGIIKAMILGDKDDLNTEAKEIYTLNGLSHILAISGLHIMLFIQCLDYMLRGLLLKRTYRVWGIFICLMLYMWLLGFVVSAIRATALGMGMLVTIGYDCHYQRQRFFYIVFCSFLIFTPYVLFSLSFILSFGAVFALFYIYPIFKQRYKKINKSIGVFFLLDSFCISLSITVMTFPVLLYFFNGISISAFLVNIFVLPIVPLFYVSALMSLCSSFFSLALGRFIAGTTTMFSAYIFAILHIWNRSYSFWKWGALSWKAIFLYYLGVFLIIFMFGVRGEKKDAS